MTSPKCIFFLPPYFSLRRDQGGLGHWKTNLVNMSLIAKSTWRILDKPHSFMSRWVKSKNCNKEIDLAFNITSQDSVCWKAIKQVAPIVSDNLRWKVDNGTNIDISSRDWSIPWFGNSDAFKAADIIDKDFGTWDLSRIEYIYPQFDVAWFIFLSKPNISFDDRLVCNVVALEFTLLLLKVSRCLVAEYFLSQVIVLLLLLFHGKTSRRRRFNK